MSTELKHMTYTKDNGEISERQVVVVSAPRTNYLVYDLSEMPESDIVEFIDTLQDIQKVREQLLSEFEAITGTKVNTLWRQFKPGGISWEE